MRILLSALYPYIFLLLFLVLPFDDYVRALPNILIVILAVLFPFVVERWQMRKLRSIPILLLSLVVIYFFLNSFLAGRLAEDFDVISKVTVALILGILYIPIHETQKIKDAIVFSALAAIAFSVYNFVLIAHETGNFFLGDSPQVVESLLIDRIYLGLLCVFSVLISFTGIRKSYHPLNSYYLANIAINVIFILLIASKIAVIALLGLLLLRQFYGRQRMWKYGIALASGVMIVGLLYVLKMKDNSGENGRPLPALITAFVSESMTYDLRATAWNCIVAISQKEKPGLTGLGFEKTEEFLVDCYSESIGDPEKNEHFTTMRYNAHSQFLDFYVSEGLLAVILFSLFIIGSFIMVRKDFYTTAMLFLLVFYCFVENVFHRQMGAYYAGAILIILMLTSSNKAEAEEKVLKKET